MALPFLLSSDHQKDVFRFVLFIAASASKLRLHARSDRHDLVDLHVLLRRIQRVAGSVEFLGRLEDRLGTEGRPGVVAGEQGLEFPDDLLGGGFSQSWKHQQISRKFRATA